MPKMTMAVDLDRCIGCYACEIACKQENDVTLGVYWNRVDKMGPFGDFPHVKMYWRPKACQQCENPACVEVCPTGASQIQEDGVVTVDQNACIGCQLCVNACPYEARGFDERTSTVGKCDLCATLRSEGDKPACVKCCPAHARIFGDIEDPTSDIAVALEAAGAENVHQLENTGTQPSVAYILHEKIGTWM